MTNPNLMTSLNNKKQTMTVLVLAMALWNGSSCLAQTGMMGDDSMLPPEVVPIDPNVVMQQPQAASNAAGMAAGQMVPGMTGGINGMQTAQQASRSMYDSLMGSNGQLPPQFANNAPQGFSPAGNGLGPAPNQLGQSGMMQPGQNAGGPLVHAQTQTLTGSVKYKPTRHDTRRGGFSNAFSSIAGFGSGIAMGGLVRRPSTLLGLGMFGGGLTGFGSRNGFRY